MALPKSVFRRLTETLIKKFLFWLYSTICSTISYRLSRMAPLSAIFSRLWTTESLVLEAVA